MVCSKMHFILSQWSSTCMMTFSKGAKSYFAKIKSMVRKSAPNTMVCWIWNIPPETAPCCRIPESAEGGRKCEEGIYYVLRWLHRSLVIAVYTVLTFHTPEQFAQLWSTIKSTWSILFSGPCSNLLVYLRKDAVHRRKCPSDYSSLNCLFSHFALLD